MEDAGDRDLLNEIGKAKRDDSLRRLHERYTPLVFSIAAAILRDRGEAQDVVQETWMRVVRAAAAFRGECPVRAWIARIARNASLDRVRSSRRRVTTVESIEVLDGARTATLERDVESIFRRVLEELPNRTQRRALRLEIFEQKKIERIAEELGTTVDGARMHLVRAKKEIRRRLAALGYLSAG